MRNRTELVTTTLPGSENEEENSEEVDSEEDWKPEKKVSISASPTSNITVHTNSRSPGTLFLHAPQKGVAGAVAKATPKTAAAAGATGAKRKSTAAAATTPKPRGRPPKKPKKEESEEEEDDFGGDDDEEDDDEEDDDEDDDEDDEAPSSGTAKKSAKKSGGDPASKPGRRAGSGSQTKSFPDKDGNFELYLFKNDLVKDFRADTKMCLWRRDGSSLLQKYIRVKEDDNGRDVFFSASSVVSSLCKVSILYF